ncbi:WD40/YVTN/BNR-like repeat-containing protein [Halorussus halophilus]|uniref:WD40/YVTN/BNR-like repeat-containing protein n=1 Tax=Halorussus halophilus TaxID=2650975 RepID=UPI001CE47B6F|nr:hypothetical protein [Halorussus halophilus]
MRGVLGISPLEVRAKDLTVVATKRRVMVNSRAAFGPFFRGYTKTWVHAVATAALTAFGMLTFVHRGFAIIAVAAYVLPPLVLYFSGRGVGREADASEEPRADDGEAEPENVDADEETGKTDEFREDSDPDTDSDTGPATTNSARWTTAETPTNSTLFDAVVTDAGAYAVGEAGVVLTDGGSEGWKVALADGPSASGRTLRGVDATDDGNAVWFAGDDGALGRLDTETGRHADHSAPADRTDSWADVAVAGQRGEETLLLVNSSGEVLRGQYLDGELALASPSKPGSGSSLVAAALVSETDGYCCDTNSGVFRTTDGGENFDEIGLDGSDGTLTALAAPERGECLVTDDGGVSHRYDGANWTPTRLGDESLWAVGVGDELRVACGDEGFVYERGEGDWERKLTTASETLRGVAVGDERAVVVGENGTVVERTT